MALEKATNEQQQTVRVTPFGAQTEYKFREVVWLTVTVGKSQQRLPFAVDSLTDCDDVLFGAGTEQVMGEMASRARRLPPPQDSDKCKSFVVPRHVSSFTPLGQMHKEFIKPSSKATRGICKRLIKGCAKIMNDVAVNFIELRMPMAWTMTRHVGIGQMPMTRKCTRTTTTTAR